jgi:hypothetical protein
MYAGAGNIVKERHRNSYWSVTWNCACCLHDAIHSTNNMVYCEGHALT